MEQVSLNQRMSQQYGVISRHQALAAGMTDKQIRRRIEARRWVRVAHGVYRHGSAPNTRTARLLGLCLAYKALASHRAAAAMHRLDGCHLDRLELVVPHGRARPIKGAILHQSTQMDLAKRADIQGVPCTGLGRTLLDMSAVVDRTRLDQAIDSVLRDGRLRLEDLYRVLVSHARRGRDGCAAFRASLEDRAGEGEVPLSAWSRMIADLLVEAGLPRPDMEYRICDHRGTFLGQVDLAYPSHLLAIELDSKRWHLNRVSFERDPARRNRLTIAGWTVLNFTWSHYVQDPRALCATVAAACRLQPDPPPPPPPPKLMTKPPT